MTGTSNTTNTITETEFVYLTTHLRCGNCDALERISPGDLELLFIDDARDVVPDCGCDDPIGYPEIHSEDALFGTPEIDDDYYHHGSEKWTYEVCDDLFDSLVEAGVATR